MRLSEIKENAYQPHKEFDLNLLEPYKEIIKEYINNDKIIYRGMQNTGSIIFGDGEKLNRKSANTRNYITLLTEVLPSWKNWPKRSKSFICSTDFGYASSYGSWGGATYIAVPISNQPIAQTKGIADFFNVFPFGETMESIFDVWDFNDSLRNLANIFSIELNQENSSTLSFQLVELIEQLKQTSDERIDGFSSSFVRQIAKNLKQKGIDYLNEVLDPNHGCTLARNFKDMNSSKGETWMSGKVIFINKHNWEAVIESLK